MASLLATAVLVPSASGAAMASKSPAAVIAPVSVLSKSPASVGLTIASKGGTKKSGNKSKKSSKTPRQVKFTASGTVTAVDAAAGTVTVQVKGGTKDVRRTAVTIAVPPAARIVVNGAGKALADVAVGYSITVTGTNSGGALTAARIEARGKKPAAKPAPAPTTKPSPGVAPSPAPSDDPTPEPADTPAPSATS